MREPKRKAGMGYILILLLILIVFAAAGVFVSKRFAPSKDMANLESYYNRTAYEYANRPEAGSNELAIILDDHILDNEDSMYFRAVLSEGDVFVAAPLLREYIDSRFYVDKNESLLIFTDALHSYMTLINSSICVVDGEEKDAGYTISQTVGEEVYVNMKFVAEHTDTVFRSFDNPGRVYIRSGSGTIRTCTAKVDVKMRTSNSKKSSIVTTVDKDSKMKVLSQEEGWLQVIDERGYIGYVQDNFISEPVEETLTSSFTEPEYTHITLDEPVNMVWHGIYYFDSNYYISDYTAEMTGVDVLAPTWFLFADTEGDLISYVSTDYLSYAHENGWQVWAVLEDMDGESCVDILPYTSKRQYVISQMLNECLAYGVDGINVDLEKVTPDLGNDFIQFIRELSVECRNNGLILSVDDYAPYSYNAYRHTYEQSRVADYVAVMAYDDYVGTGEAGPNASVPFVEEVMQLCQENVKDMSRLIVGLPFYTRAWYEYEDGSLGTDGLNMWDIENLAVEHGLTFNWQEAVGYDYAQYEEDGATVRLWYENARSLEAKLKAISKYDVGGISGWRLGQESSDVWEVLSGYYQ